MWHEKRSQVKALRCQVQTRVAPKQGIVAIKQGFVAMKQGFVATEELCTACRRSFLTAFQRVFYRAWVTVDQH